MTRVADAWRQFVSFVQNVILGFICPKYFVSYGLREIGVATPGFGLRTSRQMTFLTSSTFNLVSCAGVATLGVATFVGLPASCPMVFPFWSWLDLEI
jgi:hypothetical protein